MQFPQRNPEQSATTLYGALWSPFALKNQYCTASRSDIGGCGLGFPNPLFFAGISTYTFQKALLSVTQWRKHPLLKTAECGCSAVGMELSTARFAS